MLSIYASSLTQRNLSKQRFTSNETIVKFDANLTNLTFCANDFEFFTMYSDSLSGDNNDAKYFDKYVGVPMFKTIGRIGKCCTL